MTASFIQTAEGTLIPLTAVVKLHTGEGPDPHDTEAVFAGFSLVGTVSPGGNVQKLAENLATRAACMDGVFGIDNGAVYRRYLTGKGDVQVMHYGAGENIAWKV